jgi:hypothetical protein
MPQSALIRHNLLVLVHASTGLNNVVQRICALSCHPSVIVAGGACVSITMQCSFYMRLYGSSLPLKISDVLLGAWVVFYETVLIIRRRLCRP